MKYYALTLATLITVIAGPACWADQNRLGIRRGGDRGGSSGSSSSRIKTIGMALRGNVSPFGRNGSVGNGAQVSQRVSSRGPTNCQIGPATAPVSQCPQGGRPLLGTSIIDDVTNTNLDEISDLFADSSDTGRYNVEVRDPLNQNFRVVKSELSIQQANRIGDQLNSAFWVVVQGGGSNPVKRMVDDRAAAQRLAKELATDSSGVAPVVESIAYRIVSADVVANDTSNLKDIVNSVVENPPSPSEEPESYSDLTDQAEPMTSATFDDLFVGDGGDPSQLSEQWTGVSEGSDGRPRKFTLRLDADGQAELSLPTAEGEESKIESSYRMDDGVLVLTGIGGQEIVLGRIVKENDRRMTLVRTEGQITLFRQ